MNARRLLLPVVGAVVALTACSSTRAGSPVAQSTTARPSAVSSAPTAAATLSRTEFVTQMDSLCKSMDEASAALPSPSGPSDFAGIEAYVPKVLQLHDSFATQATALVARSGDAAALTTNFLQPDARDTATVLPLLKQMMAAAKAHDAAMLTKLSDKVSSINDQRLVDWLKGYGLPDCASLEGN